MRPVRRFVVALVALAVLFGALWWSGLVTPRLTHGDRYGSSYSSSYDSVSGRATVAFGLRNDSLFAVELRDVILGRRVSVTSASVEGHYLATGSRRLVGRGGRARVELEITCRAGGGMAHESPARIEVRVGTAIGLERTRVVGTIPLPQACFWLTRHGLIPSRHGDPGGLLFGTAYWGSADRSRSRRHSI